MSKEQRHEAFYTQSEETVLAQLESSRKGLTSTEAQQRLAAYGRNELDEGEKRSLFMKFLDQFKDLMIIILVAAAFLSVVTEGMEGLTDAIIILAVVILNAAFGVYQEGQAEAAIEALKSMSSPLARVRRDGHVIEVDSKELVPGDIVLLEAGDVVPADMRLLEVNSLKIEEAALTGESVPVEKDLSREVSADAGIGDRVNMGYQNSNVTYGRGMGVVTNTGMYTEVGHIAGMLANADETDTPLKQNLDNLSKILTYAILVIAAVTFAVGVFLRGQRPLEGLMTSVALAVAAIPEGLPAIVTVVLSLGTQVLAKRNAIIRKLPAVETLGSTEIIASDKTGTLTMNQMTVEKVYTNGALQESSADIAFDNNTLRVMNFANDTKVDPAGKLIGDPTETALVQFGLDHRFDVREALVSEPRVAELPFDSDRKLMSTIHKQADGRYFIAVKGAPDQLLKRVTQIEENGEIRPITEADRQTILATNKDLAKQALRVLMMAYKYTEAVPALETEVIEAELIFSGLVGMIDPERPEAAQAVKVAKEAGIRPIMITGDHQDTAEAIAKRLGIIEEDGLDHVFTGAELNELSDEEFQKVFRQYSVYARVSPEHKVRIVKAWQNEGKVVAMTGDGVNDAPSLKTADIGIGMGITGTEVSKGASDMVLADDNFATIIVAVEEGRKVFSNIQKTIQYLLSANMAEVFTIFLATLFGWDVLQPVHLLWINLVTDTLPAIALGVEPAEPGVMKHKPRGRQSSFFDGGVKEAILYQGALQTILVLGVYGFALMFPEHTSYHDVHADALTMAYVTLGLIQLVHAYNVKSVYQSIFTVGLFKNKLFNYSIPVAFIALMATVVVPGFNKFFHVTHLTLTQWLVVIVGSLLMVAFVEFVKAIQRSLGQDDKAI
ncbi:cation-transporting ATPase [Streptococcus equi subsp. zooepidemicus MGCS10565]|uniref:P-type Ca(2+) transporter n=1 Tax=Streptococcus equi subsp. zooepidemicus (strain MGCS10565) TaxID=552526 RepID=B4U3T3_STREM|nr:cation-translocating P-type ATPase [Streptococcus equi]ACG62650.1 cation-transporting ATPase [Streptococcus equi subsp. zooepidemicus MGCS10565]MCD3399268.1 cation-translocating P-type ATPase [Streptococcus equi subsp. zooepidemicus]MCD3451833.1 cation-translocating P-type ATPase [Streptococcus equi subsp. zooepidemicus]MDI6034889.1 cation-translocating P-type ATPase [Streptococcus equi subsp. zooepidemicus]SQF54331.1 cation transporting ATPase [Streptococcus equi subsp. zooepidemicus]